MYSTQAPKQRVIQLVIEAVTLRAKSLATIRGVVKHASAIVRFYIEVSADDGVELTGGKSIVLIRDYLESLAERGRTVPGAAKDAISLFADAIGIEWPLTHPLVLAAETVEANDFTRQAPPTKLDTIKQVESLARNKLAPPYQLAFSAGVALVTYASLRFSDVQRIRSFDVNSDSVWNALKFENQERHCQFWPFAFPLEGIAGPTDWDQPILMMQEAYRKLGDRDLTCTFPCVDHAWELVSTEPESYSATRWKLALVCVALGDTDGETYTPHSPKNLFPTAANQMNFDHRELNIVGQWSSTSRMPERYGRSVCADELLLRDTIARKLAEGWEPAPAFRLPYTVSYQQRLGKAETPPCPDGDAHACDKVVVVVGQVDDANAPTQVVGEEGPSPDDLKTEVGDSQN